MTSISTIQPSAVATAAVGPSLDRAPSLPWADAGALARAYDQCREVTRTRARNFYYGLRLTPEPRRSALYSIYAWMRAADDEADAATSPERKAASLQRIRQLTARALAADPGLVHEAPYWTAFAATLHTFPIPHDAIGAMLDGLEEDLSHAGYATEEDLDRYCYRVASTVGLVCVSIWGTRPGADAAVVRRCAEDRGRAFQLTNILRDFRQDFDADPPRVYLPATSFRRAGLRPDDVRAWRDDARCRAFIAEHAARARALYDASAPLDSLVEPASRPALWAMTAIYSRILALIERDPARVVSAARIRLSSYRKGAIALRALLGARRARVAGRSTAR